MKDIEIKNMVKLFTVLMLSEKAQHGYEIMKEVKKRTGKCQPGADIPIPEAVKKIPLRQYKGQG